MTIEKLKRVFLMEQNGKFVSLADPDPKLSKERVMNLYSNTYPILTTAKIEGPEVKDDSLQYKFISVLGTKG